MTLRAPLRPSALALLAAAFLGPFTSAALAAALEVRVVDRDGRALEHAVVSLHDGSPRRAPAGARATIDQRSRQFGPTVVPLQAGTEVSFPNSDDVRHHVYSFSHPNAFELKLYHGEPSRPVRFDEPGIVVLGCNIHDGMVGYLQVLDTPLFGRSAASGIARVEDVPSGRYTLGLWHPDLGTRHVRRPLTLGDGTTRLTLTIDPAAAGEATLAAGTPADAGAEALPGRADDTALARELGSLFRD